MRRGLRQFTQASLASVLIAGLFSPCAAQQVPAEPASTHIFPAGGRRGAIVPVRVGGEFLAPYTRFRLFGDGISCQGELVERATGNYEPSPRRKPGGTPINYPREWQAEVAIAADAPLGQKLWRVSSARGGTGGRPFVVGDLPEFIESESNSSFAKAERIVLPVTINGQIAGERDLDYFRFEAAAGEVVSIEVAAARLGSPLDPVIEVLDAEGRRLNVEELRVGSDPVLALRAPASGEYALLVSNLNFRGGPQYVYRITVSTAPFVTFAFPAGGQAGSSATIEFFSLSGGGPLRSTQEMVAFPSSAAAQFAFVGSTPAVNAVALESTDIAAIVEAEPNDAASQAAAISWPAVVYGRLSRGTDADWYAITVAKDQELSIECRPVSPGSGSLPAISLCDSEGRPLAQASTVELAPKPCRLEWRASADGKHLLHVRDVRQGGGETPYRLSLRPLRPDFSLTASADFANVVQGARGELELKVDRQGSLSGLVDLSFDGLPEGVRAEPLQIPKDQDSIKVALIAADDTRPGDVLLKISGTARSGEEALTRQAVALHLGRDVEGVSLGSPTVDHVQLTVRHKQVFRLFCSEAYQYAHRGTIYPYQMEVERMNGFDGPISLEISDRQIMDLDGVKVIDSVIPAGVSQLMLPLHLPENMHINVQPHSNIYAQGYAVFQDQWGQRQSMLQVSEMRCMIRPLPTVARLRAQEKSICVRPGKSQTCTLHLDRTTNFAGAMSVEQVESISGVCVTPVLIPPGQSAAVVTINVAAEIMLPPQTQLKLRGVGELPEGGKVVSEVALPVSCE